MHARHGSDSRTVARRPLLLAVALQLGLATGCFVDGLPGRTPASEDGTPSADAGGPTEAEYAACFARHEEVLQALGDLARVRAGPCTWASDCVTVTLRIPCMDACSQVVARAKEPEFASALAAYGAQVCPGLPRTCNVAPSCVDVRPVCDQGVCRAVPATGGGDCSNVACGAALPPLTLTVAAPAGRTLEGVQVTGAPARCGAVSPGEVRCEVYGSAGPYVLDVQAPGYRTARVELTVPASTPVPGQCCSIPYVPQTARTELVPEG